MPDVTVERREAVRAKRTRDRRKALVVEEFQRRGSRCNRCGAKLVLGKHQWHHEVPEEKLFPISKAWRYTAEKITAELAKCELLCMGCHRSEHPEGNWTNRAAA